MKRGRVSAKTLKDESENNSRENDEIYQKAKQLKIIEETRQYELPKTTSLPESMSLLYIVLNYRISKGFKCSFEYKWIKETNKTNVCISRKY